MIIATLNMTLVPNMMMSGGYGEISWSKTSALSF
jgi:hypothetical protein